MQGRIELPILPGRDGPVAKARLDCLAAEEDPALPFGHADHHDLEIAVVNRAAGGANVARPVVALRNAKRDRLSAVAAEIHF